MLAKCMRTILIDTAFLAEMLTGWELRFGRYFLQTGILPGNMKKLFGRKNKESEQGQQGTVTAEEQQMIEDFEAVKNHPGQITGWDFDRAFGFIENYPESEQAELLMNQMYAISSEALKGLSYESAVKVLERMPDHSGADSIVKGMYKIEADYIVELTSPVIAYMLDIIPDHPLGDQLATALANKNIANAYDFVNEHPDSVYARRVIKSMFKRSANISLLLFQERMDHPQVESIFEGIYSICDKIEIAKLTPNAIIFILEVAPDHPQTKQMLKVFVDVNHIKAFEFVKENPDHPCIEELKTLIIEKMPSFQALL